jgi:hypothetical protein
VHNGVQHILCCVFVRLVYEEFEDTKGVIRIRKSKTNRQNNGQKKNDKRTNNDVVSFSGLSIFDCSFDIL